MTATGDEGCTGEDFTDAVFADQLWEDVLADSVLERCSRLGSTVGDCRLRPWTLREVDLSLTALGHADLREVVLAGLRLTEANLVQARLPGTRIDVDTAIRFAVANGLRVDLGV